jgi:predicted nuclease of predicted toxin-antitoxin system
VTFLSDHDAWAATVEVLVAEGHDVVTAMDLNLAQAPNRTVLREASTRDGLLLAGDRDSGRLVFAEGHQPGVLFLRIAPSTQQVVHEKLLHVVDTHPLDELRRAFTVIEPGQYRIRRPS